MSNPKLMLSALIAECIKEMIMFEDTQDIGYLLGIRKKLSVLFEDKSSS